MWNWGNTSRRFLGSVHNAYVKSFECLNKGFNTAREALPSSERVSAFVREHVPLPSSIQGAFTTARDFTLGSAQASATKVIQWKNHLTFQKENASFLHEYHPEVQSLRGNIETELALLSTEYSILSEETHTFSKIPFSENSKSSGKHLKR